MKILGAISAITFCALMAPCSSEDPSVQSSSAEVHYMQVAHIHVDGTVSMTQTKVMSDAPTFAGIAHNGLPSAGAPGASTESISVECQGDPGYCIGDTRNGCNGDVVIFDDARDCGFTLYGNILCLTWDGTSPGYINLTDISYPGGGNWGGKARTVDPTFTFDDFDFSLCSTSGCASFLGSESCQYSGEFPDEFSPAQYATCVCISGYCNSCPN